MFTSSTYLQPPTQGPHVVVIGNFDGLHRGHQALLERAYEVSTRLQITRCILTFDPHPSRFFGRDEPKSLYSSSDKLSLLKALGVEATLHQTFDHTFASLSPQAFVEEVLVGGLNAQAVIVGYDFAFGTKRSGKAQDLIELCAPFGIEVDMINPQCHQTIDHAYSSTWIRSLIKEGKLTLATEALTRPYHLRGIVVHGYQRGRTLGFPTANLALSSELCPAPGVYSGWLDWGIGPHPCVFSVGENPTFQEPHLLAQQQEWSIEVHVISEASDQLELYEKHVILWCHRKIRDMKRFDDLESLKNQIALDRKQALETLHAAQVPTWPRASHTL